MIKYNKFISGLLAAAMTAVMLPAGSVSAAQVLSVTGGGQEIGNEGGYSYELWQDKQGGGTSIMTLGDGATFDCQWDCSGSQGNFLARRGMRFDCTQTYKDIGNIAFDYSVDYHPGNQGSSYLCVYGWTRDPLVEYYIVDNWKNWRPPNGAAPGQGSPIATVEIDGGLYDIYKSQRVDCPSIDGTQTFWQYWSVRQEPRSSGVINVAKHFETWESYGLEMGKFYEAALNIEGYESTGYANVTKNDVTLGDIKETEPPTEAEPDADGWYFHSDFESGKDDWESRGDASIASTDKAYYKGSKAASVTGCTDYWNGIARSLSTSVFKPGSEYSFTTMAMQNATASEKFKLTLEYTDSTGEKQYDTIAEATGTKGEWVQLSNTAYKIPAGAKGLLIYVETDETTTDFFIDEAAGGKAGTEYTVDVQPSTGLKGDVNADGSVSLLDIVTLQKYLLGIKTTIREGNADLNADSAVDIFDLALLKRQLLSSSGTPVTTDPVETPTISGTDYMASIKNTLTTNYGDANTRTAGVDYGDYQEITYFSEAAGHNKQASILLPANYDTSKKYPVMYVNHGIFGNHYSMREESMGVQNMSRNLAAKGEAKEMIIVLTSMYTDPNGDAPAGMNINLEVTQKYDAIREDLIGSLMPYINEHYSTLTGRENTAICGFSMGGRESLYVGVTRPEYFGYIGAACPAPGVTPGKDGWMDHPGNMAESEFKITDPANQPYMLFIAGGTNDGVVGTFPQQYDQILTRNGQEHLWLEVPGGGHDASVVAPMMYNFIRNVFKAQ